MKTIQILLLIITAVLLSSCHHTLVGFLDTSNVSYSPDSLVIRKLDPETADSITLNNKIPWQSPEIEGVDGTFPVTYSIYRVTGNNITPAITAQFNIVRKGVIEIAPDNTLPPGTYLLDIQISNEDHDDILPGIFRVIVE